MSFFANFFCFKSFTSCCFLYETLKKIPLSPKMVAIKNSYI
ncbi:hypothetical protein DB43_DW00180 [Parachlamydia acanthamoebae]|uniref:Uncharacterized protein n=1 Tax=Parachlamydia acanthamoebae TaxID=83552 RepID=A0A0C1EBQ5_9BACT|nr:hypothetical protein DB43_DW00180 [Parachlamydia acanthamoebae]